MALVPGTGVAGSVREDLVIFACTFDNDDAVNAANGTLTNGTTPGFNIRNAGGALCPPVAVMAQLDTQIAASVPFGVAISGNNIVVTKTGAGAGNGAATAFHLLIFGPKSKGVG